jgi:hypothetical protein
MRKSFTSLNPLKRPSNWVVMRTRDEMADKYQLQHPVVGGRAMRSGGERSAKLRNILNPISQRWTSQVSLIAIQIRVFPWQCVLVFAFAKMVVLTHLRRHCALLVLVIPCKLGLPVPASAKHWSIWLCIL